MKRSVLYSNLLFSCLLLIISFLAGCHNVDCMAPPSEIAIQIMDGGLVYPAELDTAAHLKVSYQENSQQKYVADLVRSGDVFHSSMFIEDSYRLHDPEFSFELDGRILAKIKLETYRSHAKCNDWAKISKVYQNTETVSRSANGAYLIK